LRAILHKDREVWAILHAGHHDAAYAWAERRDVGRHSVTGALQIVESVETVREVERIIEVFVEAETPPTFERHDDAYLLSIGVPESWLPTLRKVRDDDQLLVVCEKLPPDIAERLLALAAGELVTPPAPVSADRPATDAEDTRRRFFVADDAGELAAALEAPLERWIAFLHPSQRALIKKDFKGPVKVSGSAGTGKTVVAMHRARHLAQQGESVLLTSYVTTLCENIDRNLTKLCRSGERARIVVSTVHKQALALVRQVKPRVRPASDEEVRGILEQLRVRHAPEFDGRFVSAEWDNVVRLHGLSSWDEYRSARRTGRGRGVSVKQRKALWAIFGEALDLLQKKGLLDWPGLCARASALLDSGAVQSPFSAVVVDEVQDLKPPELLFLRALCVTKPENLMVCGDAGQRIYPGGFSLGALGINIRGRSVVLRINYRTTEQIRRMADAMLGDSSDDMDGGAEARSGTRSLLRGPTPSLLGYPDQRSELEGAVAHIKRWLGSGVRPEEVAVFARTGKLLDGFGSVLDEAGFAWRRLSDKADVQNGELSLGTMHRAKGLEFKAVLVMGCSDSAIPSPVVLRAADDPLDKEVAEAMEKHLLYVAMTRARDELAVTWFGAPSRFLEPLLNGKESRTA
jgi:superfamily I DNA/RNA helicase